MRVGEVASAGGVNEETLRCHVTNGDSAGNTLRQTALDGIVVAWRDMLPEGPLARVPAPDFRRLRARFLGDCGWGEPAAVEAEMQRRDQTFADALAAGHRIACGSSRTCSTSCSSSRCSSRSARRAGKRTSS